MQRYKKNLKSICTAYLLDEQSLKSSFDTPVAHRRWPEG
jgi:hypothetical protein